MKPDAEQLEVLKNIAVTAFASDRLSEDTWSSMCAWASAQDYETLAASFKVVEKEMKAAYKVPHMPSAWRSAKTDIMKAVKLGLEFYDKSESKAVPKTALEAKMKKPVVPMTAIGKFIDHAHQLIADWKALTGSEQGDPFVKVTVNEVQRAIGL